MSTPTQLSELNSAFAHADAIAFEMSPLGGVVVRLTCGADTATVALQGAQVLGWRHRRTEMLWLLQVARLGTGKAVRGGIPVCWPWFGPHPSDPGRPAPIYPAHGFVRTRDWAVTASSVSPEAVTITLQTTTLPEDQALFPHAAVARLTTTLGNGLSLGLTTHNTGATAVPLSQALHTYFRVGDIAGVRIEGLAGTRYIDKLGDGKVRRLQEGPIAIESEVDRIYLGHTQAITLRGAHAGNRQLTIESEGSASAVVWNPWIDKTARLGDMGGPNAWRHMVCIETANAGDDVRTLAPGAEHVMSAHYRVV